MGRGFWICHAEHFEPGDEAVRTDAAGNEFRRNYGSAGGAAFGFHAGVGDAEHAAHFPAQATAVAALSITPHFLRNFAV